MDVDTFTKICKDCKFYNENFNMDDAASLFARVIPGSRSTMNAEEFDFALSRVAEMRLHSLKAFARSYARLVVLDGDLIFTKAKQPSASCTSSVATSGDRGIVSAPASSYANEVLEAAKKARKPTSVSTSGERGSVSSERHMSSCTSSRSTSAGRTSFSSVRASSCAEDVLAAVAKASKPASTRTSSVSTSADSASFSSPSTSSLPSPAISPRRSSVCSPSQPPSSGHRSPQPLPPVAPRRHSFPRSPPIKATHQAASCPQLPRRRASVCATHPLGRGW